MDSYSSFCIDEALTIYCYTAAVGLSPGAIDCTLSGSSSRRVMSIKHASTTATTYLTKLLFTLGKKAYAAGMKIEGSSVSLLSCSFVGNTVGTASAGAMAIQKDSTGVSPTVTMSKCSFSSNEGIQAGAIWLVDGALTMRFTGFGGNVATGTVYEPAGVGNDILVNAGATITFLDKCPGGKRFCCEAMSMCTIDYILLSRRPLLLCRQNPNTLCLFPIIIILSPRPPPAQATRIMLVSSSPPTPST